MQIHSAEERDVAVEYDSFRKIIEGRGRDDILRTIAFLTNEDMPIIQKTFNELVLRVLSIPLGRPPSGVLLSGRESVLCSGINEVFIMDFFSGNPLPPGNFTFDSVINMKTDAAWVSKRNAGVVADVFWWLSIYKSFFIGESEKERERHEKIF